MAYKIASLTFFNNSEDRVSYSSDNPFLWAIYAGLSFHEPIAPKTSEILAASNIWRFCCGIGGKLKPYFSSGYSLQPSKRFGVVS